MTDIQEQEALARQLRALYVEALGYTNMVDKSWDVLDNVQREAWIQVAQFVEAQYRNEKPQPMQERTPFNGHIYYLNPNDEPDHR